MLMAWLLALPALWLAILLLYFRPLRAAWREPVLHHPVLIIESDDWGPGPPGHALALRRLTDCLAAFRDNAGRPPVMTLGLTLSLPDGAAMAASGFTDYQSRPFTDPAYAGILEAIRAGIGIGIFAPQLHGMAHYWPDALLRAARTDESIRQWLAGGNGLETESLPSPLQSRWIDATSLPSSPLPPLAIEAAAGEEVACFTSLFGKPPEVVVPPTFVWTPVVERAWAKAGLRCLVTPGRRYDSRDGAGRPAGPDGRIHNGERGEGGLLYLVRDDYFEPSYGHRAGQALAALEEKTTQGRPCLLETHRFNFTGEQADSALSTLGGMLTQALGRFTDLRFTSSAELAEQYRGGGDWLEPRLGRRYVAWLARLRRLPRFWKLARLSGLGFVLVGLGKVLA
jgi:hypothetical protein